MTTTLLAVDDSVTMRKVLEITFAGETYKTVLASSGQEALKLLAAERPAMALIDHTLPDMSGYDLARDLKAQQPNLAVIILSSKQSPYDKARGSASAVDDFMDKPFDTQKFLDKVAQVLAQPRAAAAAPAAAPSAPRAAPSAPRAAPPPAPAHAPHAPPPMPTHTSAGPRPVQHAPVPASHVAAPPAASPTASVAARPRTQTAQGAPPAAPSIPQRPPTPASLGTPKPAVAHPAPAAPAAPPPKPAAPAVVAAAASAALGGNGQLPGKLEALGLSPTQVEGVLALSREVVEKVVWEVVPVLAETLIKEEIRRLTSG